MAKNFAAIYNNTNDASALEQQWFLKEETTRGVLAAPTDTDFLFALSGGTLEYAQPFESSPHRTGRHHNSFIKQKKTMSWSFSTFFNLDPKAGSPAAPMIDQPVRELWESLTGRETEGGADLTYDSQTAPAITFSLFSNSDKFAQQGSGCFVQDGTANFPGDGQATMDWSGMGKTAITIGIAALDAVDNNGGNTITLVAADGRQMSKNGLVMLIEADGTTRSADTPNGSPRTITDITGDVVTVDGAALADADGTGGAIYLAYYEPESPEGIDDPLVGLTGSIVIAGHSNNCIRNLTLNMANGHEVVDYCFGEDALSGPLFVPGDRFSATVSMQINMSKSMVGLFRDIEEFVEQDITLILGDTTPNAGQYFQLLLPKVIFPVPTISIPESGSIPVDFSDGIALQTGLSAGDEVEAKFIANPP